MGLFRGGHLGSPSPPEHPVRAQGQMERFVRHLVGHSADVPGDVSGDAQRAVRVGAHREAVALR
ncbi:hypothetical protein [Streptomyces atroolivaceus]|uniref:hypothetical protein n=1 Tax=Streptomyces atroolivaceus TaxID=66869 RepID=UPI00363B0AF6